MNIEKVIPLVFLLYCGITFFSCTYKKENNDPCQSTVPDSVSFKRDLIPLFSGNCIASGCHSGGSPAGHLNLEPSLAYAQLSKSGSGYLNVANPTHSLLYSQLNSSSQPMPPTGKMEVCKINLVLKWIEQGAQNN